MANVRYAASARNAILDQVRTLIDAGSSGGTIKIYTGTQPATGDTALSGNTLLGTLTFTDPAAPPATGGLLTFSAIAQDASADNSGTATFARIQDSNGVNVFDCDVGTSGAAINLNTTTITAGGPIQITSFTDAVASSITF